MFQPLKDTLPELIRRINKSKKYDWDLSPESQQNLCSKLLDEFGSCLLYTSDAADDW